MCERKSQGITKAIWTGHLGITTVSIKLCANPSGRRWDISLDKWKLTCWWHYMKSQGITKFMRIPPLGTMNICTKVAIHPIVVQEFQWRHGCVSVLITKGQQPRFLAFKIYFLAFIMVFCNTKTFTLSNFKNKCSQEERWWFPPHWKRLTNRTLAQRYTTIKTGETIQSYHNYMSKIVEQHLIKMPFRTA